MNVDFSLILVLLVLLCGVVWALGAVFRQGSSWPVEYAKSFFPLLLLVLVLRSFIFEPFRIPSGSMKPTLLIGDFILVNKFAYGVRLPVIHKKILDMGEPDRGDVAVFRFPRDPRLDYIKRIVGVPGDRIQYRDKKLTVNGVVAAQRMYFAVGDNRDNSNDSRYWGTVPEENLVGKAFMVWMHFNWDNGGVKWSRIGDRIN